MGYKEYFTVSLAAFLAFGVFLLLSFIIFFKLDIINIIKIFIRKLKIMAVILAPIFIFSGEILAYSGEDEPLYKEESGSEIRFKTRVFALDNTIYYPDLGEDFFTFFVTVKNPLYIDTIEVYVDERLCFKSLRGDNLSKEIPIMLRQGYEPGKIVIVNRAKTGNIIRNFYKLEKDNEGPVLNQAGLEVLDVTGPVLFNKKFKAFITGQNLVVVKIKDVKDEKSGMNSLYFKYYTGNAEHTIKAEYDKDNKEFFAEVYLPKNSNREFFAVSRDNLYNISSTEEDFINIITDNTDPSLDINVSGEYYESSGDLIFKDRISVDIGAGDLVGIKEISVFINDSEAICKEDMYSPEGGLLKEYEFIIREDLFKEEKNDLRIVVENFGGHKAVKEVSVFRDNTSPILSNVMINGMEREISENSKTCFSKEDTYISFQTEDYDDFGEKRSGVISDIKLLLYDIKNNPVDVREIECDKAGNVEIQLKKGFKGYGIIRVRDVFSNELSYKTGLFVLEGEEDFKNSSSISFKNDKNLTGLSEVKMPIVVKSEFSGIKEVRYKVVSPNDTKENKSGNLAINGKYDEGLLVSGEGELLVRNNSNDIKISIELVSNCGNLLEEYVIFNIDSTYPIVNLEFLDGEDSYYINHDRTLKIEITERNFLMENLSLNIIKNGKNTADSIDFKTIEDEKDPDKNKHVALVEFKDEGEYSIYGGFRDTAGNTVSITEKNFLIDKKSPLGELIYYEDFADGDYINSPLRVDLKITEEFLDVNSVEIHGISPGDKSYSYENGIYTLQMYFNEPGEYQFSVYGKDLAGNSLQSITSRKFILDLIMPNVLIYDLINLKSYNDSFFFHGELNDEYLDTERSEISLVKISKGSNLNFYQEESFGKVIFGVTDVPKLPEYDGIYELLIEGVDFAGNKMEESYRFSINRFGSVFMPGNQLLSISNSYTRVLGDIDIVEVNYDIIDPLSTRVFLFRNGNTKLLNIEEDYEISSSTEGFKNSLTYNIKGNNFDEDGIYAISIYSKDNAGNTNVTNKSDSLISFVVDRTPPRIYSLNLSSKDEYKKPVNMEIKAFDNMKLSSVSAFNNDKPINIEKDEDKYKIHLPVSNKKYNIKLLAKDTAGNVTETKIGNISVGYENKFDMKTTVFKIILSVIFLTSIILIIKGIKRRFYGKREDRRAH